jgi:hypothetical protein
MTLYALADSLLICQCRHGHKGQTNCARQRDCSLSPNHQGYRMKVVLLIAILCGFLYQTSAIAKDQDGIVIFGQGILGCAKHHVVATATNEIRVKCNLGSNTVVDINRKISANCSGIIEGTWRLAPDKIMYTNIYIYILIIIILYAIVLRIIKNLILIDLLQLT